MMDAKKWEAFLSDPKLNNNQYKTPDGSYLLGKILHEVLHCLNMSDKCFDLLAQENPEIVHENGRWLVQKRDAIQLLIIDVQSYWKYVNELPIESDKWPSLIEKVGLRLAKVPAFMKAFVTEAEKIEITNNVVISTIVSQLQALDLIIVDIQAEGYKRLWTTLRYRDLK